MSKLNPFRYFKTSPEVIRLAVMMYVRFPLSLRNVEDPLHERGSATSATRRCASGGTGLGHSWRGRSANAGRPNFARSPNGAGTSTRCS